MRGSIQVKNPILAKNAKKDLLTMPHLKLMKTRWIRVLIQLHLTGYLYSEHIFYIAQGNKGFQQPILQLRILNFFTKVVFCFDLVKKMIWMLWFWEQDNQVQKIWMKWYNSNKIRKTQNDHQIIVFQNLIGL